MLVNANDALKLYDQNDAFVRELLSSWPNFEFWRPDSVGIYYWTGSSLFYLQIPDGEPILVDENVDLRYGYYFSNYLWVK